MSNLTSVMDQCMLFERAPCEKSVIEIIQSFYEIKILDFASFRALPLFSS